MNLDQIQRAMWNAVRQPLTSSDGMRAKSLDGRSQLETANSIIKPNDRLTSFERLEIYNRQYWYRIISAMADDFEGLRSIVGEKKFHKLVVAYLVDHPSKSFTLRNLGSKLEQWLAAHLDYVAGLEDIALDMVKLEWAEVEAFDSEALPRMTPEAMAQLGADPVLHLQPYLRVLELKYPLHNLLLNLRERRRDDDAPVRKLPARSLPKTQQTFVAVHRLYNSVYFKDIEPQAFTMLSALQQGLPVSEAAAAADWGEMSMDDVANAIREQFANWASLGWFCKAG